MRCMVAWRQVVVVGSGKWRYDGGSAGKGAPRAAGPSPKINNNVPMNGREERFACLGRWERSRVEEEEREPASCLGMPTGRLSSSTACL